MSPHSADQSNNARSLLVQKAISMSDIVFDAATLLYPGNETPTINNLDLTVHDGEFLAVVGPSGSGKSTTLRMVAGLEAVTGGEIFIGNQRASQLPPSKRDVAMVFQSYALYPHMTVGENMEFALKMQKVDKASRAERVSEAAKLLELEPYLDRLPKALSGGQRQRVAMGRAIVRDPQVFLMDEPLSNLDAKLRVSTRSQISRLQRKLETTMLYVTHDQTEAMTMADRIAVLEGGNMQQVGTPEDLYLRPANVFVATFIGSPSMNLVSAVKDGSELKANGFTLPVPELQDQPNGRDVIIGIRPEDFELCGSTEADILGTVEYVENFGSDKYVHIVPQSSPVAAPPKASGTSDEETTATLLVRVANTEVLDEGAPISVRIKRDKLHLFCSHTKERIN